MRYSRCSWMTSSMYRRSATPPRVLLHRRQQGITPSGETRPVGGRDGGGRTGTALAEGRRWERPTSTASRCESDCCSVLVDVSSWISRPLTLRAVFFVEPFLIPTSPCPLPPPPATIMKPQPLRPHQPHSYPRAADPPSEIDVGEPRDPDSDRDLEIDPNVIPPHLLPRGAQFPSKLRRIYSSISLSSR